MLDAPSRVPPTLRWVRGRHSPEQFFATILHVFFFSGKVLYLVIKSIKVKTKTKIIPIDVTDTLIASV